MMNVTNVTIVGAGPTGLVLACDLLSRGINVVIMIRRVHHPRQVEQSDCSREDMKYSNA